MKRETKRLLWIGLAVSVSLIWTGILVRRNFLKPWTIMGAVLVLDADTRKQLPVADVEIITANPLEIAPSRTDASGFFKLKVSKSVRKGRVVKLKFRHPDYRPLDIDEIAGNKILVVHLVPLHREAADGSKRPPILLSNIRVRYSMKAMRTVNIGSAVKTFQAENIGNVPCEQRLPCSPDGKWKAVLGSSSLDAGLGNAFQNVRVSCIAGPCPFTKVQPEEFSKDNQRITVSASNWSDTATFLIEAEVVHTMQSPIDHQSFPVIFGPALTFTLPTDAEGVSLEADVAGSAVIFPLGPDLILTWANCVASSGRDETSVYRCELKTGYQFQ